MFLFFRTFTIIGKYIIKLYKLLSPSQHGSSKARSHVPTQRPVWVRGQNLLKKGREGRRG